MAIELLDYNHKDAIVKAFDRSREQIRVISPFVQGAMTRYLVGAMSKGIKSQLITRFYREDFIKSVSSLTALKSICSAGVDIYALKELHAKLYLFDDNVAIIGSANFTGGGFGNNIELSLYIENEYDLISRLTKYFEQLLSSIQTLGDYRINIKKIEEEILLVQKSIKGRDYTSKPNPTRFGADVKTKQTPDIVPIDEVERILEVSDEIISAVLKFEGAAHRRIDSEIIYKPNYYKHKRIYFTASSKSPRSLNEETTIFISAISWDKSGAGIPIIVGKAKTRGYDPKNVTDNCLKKEHPWTIGYKYYIELFDIETVNTKVNNCISLNDLIAEVGYKLYPNTKDKSGTTMSSLKTRHHQKAYIAITTYAANRINIMLEEKFKQYGKVNY